MKFHFISRKTLSHETKHTLHMQMGNMICGLQLDRTRPHSLELNRQDILKLLNMFRDDQEKAMKYLLTIITALSED